MLPTVFPLRAILSQFLILWLAIAIESWFFQKFLKLTPKTSVEYVAVINLFSTCMGWFIFFIWEGLMSPDEIELLMGYMLLGQWHPISPVLIFAAFLIYSISFLLKWQGLELLEFLVRGNKKKPIVPLLPGTPNLVRRPQKFSQISTQSAVVLIAHSFSHCIILLVLYLESK
ncbi:MAG TPA: hypothetical protein VK211_03500 [Kamptonema sp.]|nr:hypothetical protein [Kamptonema sp.]